MKFEISLFRFDYKSDYLPYYTKHFLKVDDETSLLDMFNIINEDQEFSYINDENEFVVVNDIYTPLKTSAKKLKENFGLDLNIEPLSIRRACNDFIINEDDFNAKPSILSKFITSEAKELYNSYKVYFYASNTLNFEYDYIGDAILLLAANLIEKNNSYEKEILEALNAQECGIEYHTNLAPRILDFNQEIEDKIQNLKKKLVKETTKIKPSKTINFGDFEKNSEIKYDFNEFTLAYYQGVNNSEETKNLLSNLKAKVLNSSSYKQEIPLETSDSRFTYKIASKIMLDAFDSGADLLVVDKEEHFYLLDQTRQKLSNTCGRDVLIPVIHKNELQMLATGEHEKVRPMLESHAINPDII